VKWVLLEVFYEHRKDELVAALTRYSGDRETAADAVQESFLKALNNRALLSEMQEKTLWSWLYTTAKNALVDTKRKTSRTELCADFEEADLSGDPIDAILVGELLYKLPPNLIHIVSLRYFGGLNATEIGELKGIPAATVRSQLRAALSILRRHASKSDFF